MALAVAANDAVVTGIHVVTPTRVVGMRSGLAVDVTADLELAAMRLGQEIQTAVREAPDIETGILDAVIEMDADLLILGTSVRAGTTRLHLGPSVEFLVRLAPCPVVIVNS